MRPRKQHVSRIGGGRLVEDQVIVFEQLALGVPAPRVGDDCGAWGDRRFHERAEAGSAHVRDHLHADPAQPPLINDLNCNSDNGFSLSVAATPPFFHTSNVGLIDLDDAVEPAASRTDHRPTKLVQPSPRGLIALQSEIPLEAQGVRSILLTGDLPSRQEPGSKRTACAVEDRPGQHRSLSLALSAHEPPARRPPRWANCPAARADEAVPPANSREVGQAALLIGEELVEFDTVAGVVHPSLELRSCDSHDPKISGSLELSE